MLTHEEEIKVRLFQRNAQVGQRLCGPCNRLLD